MQGTQQRCCHGCVGFKGFGQCFLWADSIRALAMFSPTFEVYRRAVICKPFLLMALI